MKCIIFLLVLISYTLCDSQKSPRIQISDIYKTFKTKIYKCILETEGVSPQLKELATKNLDSDEAQFINFESIGLSLEDRHIIRECIKQAFRKKNDNKNSGVIPLDVDNAVHRRKFILRDSRKLRQLSMISQIGRLGAFNIGGIFTCIENAQPAIKVIRDSINLIKSMDYTSAIINIYDNLSDISNGLSFCFNAIFPSN